MCMIKPWKLCLILTDTQIYFHYEPATWYIQSSGHDQDQYEAQELQNGLAISSLSIRQKLLFAYIWSTATFRMVATEWKNMQTCRMYG